MSPGSGRANYLTATSAAWKSPGPPQETLELMNFLREIQAHHRLTLLIIEHNLRLVMHLCEHLTVLDHGLTIAAGVPGDVQKHPQVIKAYLGN